MSKRKTLLTCREHLERADEASARKSTTAAKEKANVLEMMRYTIAAADAAIAGHATKAPTMRELTRELVARARRAKTTK